MKTVLVTGFEPFGGETINPAQEIARNLHGAAIAGHRVEGALLPCVFGDAIKELQQLLRVHRPMLVICVGQAGGRAAVTPERVAINVDDARIPDSIATQVAEIFSGDIDFHRALRKGDRFSIVYETLEGDGEPLRAGRVLSTEFMNAGKSFQAMWFQDPLGGSNGILADAASHSLSKGGYYTLAGESLRKAFLASPLEFSRVTSGFKMRFHPILQTWRALL
ncbi:MAG: hypothetical protein CFE44_26225, partial [Burkholderiales bacterium PBB4]